MCKEPKFPPASTPHLSHYAPNTGLKFPTRMIEVVRLRTHSGHEPGCGVPRVRNLCVRSWLSAAIRFAVGHLHDSAGNDAATAIITL